LLQFRGFQRATEKLPASKTIKSSRNAFVVCKDDVSHFFNGASETIDAIEVPIWGGPIHLIYVQSTEHDDRSLSSKLKVTNYALPPKQQLSTKTHFFDCSCPLPNPLDSRVLCVLCVPPPVEEF
jgi:alpha/beta superfamily hydrolase